jgi:transposase
MSARFVNIDRDTPLLLPEDLRKWVPENHIVHFIIEAVGELDIRSFKVNENGSGDEQYPPEMMLALLIYGYVTKRMSSRVIEEATYTDIGARYICGNEAHPDHSVICRFRTNNREAFREAFTKVLMMAVEMGVLKRVGWVSVDGTKVHANASKHGAVSYKRAVEMIEELEGEVEGLIRKAEDADRVPLESGLKIPEEIERREERKAALESAKGVMEERYEQARKEREQGKGGRGGGEQGKEGKAAQTGQGKPLEEYQYNFTDPESRIMLTGKKTFEQCYNAQAAVDMDTMLVVGRYVTDHGNDKKELGEIVREADTEVYTPERVCADAGFFSEEEIVAVEARNEEGECKGPEVYGAVERGSHHKSVRDIERQEEPEALGPGATVKEQMAHKLKTKEGKEIYRKRKQTVEPVFGIIKAAMGFRQFLLRGLEKVNLEWELVTLAYDFKRLYALKTG